MAKQNKSNKSIPQEKNSAKGISKMKMFFYWFIIPLLFALALLLIIAQIFECECF